MTVGEKILQARKRAGFTLAALGKEVGMTPPGVAKIEGGKIKKQDAETLVKIADALNDLSILVHHCQSCPIRKYILLKQFPELNNIRHDPAVIATRLRKEMVEAAEALDTLAERFSDRNFKDRTDYLEVFEREMEQVIDVKRGIEILEFELILSGVHSSKDLQDIYDKQQKKCEKRGHHDVACEQEVTL
ncbi:MAG: helix-turn-helix domain-containing protein [Proteobacteria bacterium]|nr:helix-turn-helix domain-containing protein [Pseudomonadota bacterium]